MDNPNELTKELTKRKASKRALAKEVGERIILKM